MPRGAIPSSLETTSGTEVDTSGTEEEAAAYAAAEEAAAAILAEEAKGVRFALATGEPVPDVLARDTFLASDTLSTGDTSLIMRALDRREAEAAAVAEREEQLEGAQSLATILTATDVAEGTSFATDKGTTAFTPRQFIAATTDVAADAGADDARVESKGRSAELAAVGVVAGFLTGGPIGAAVGGVAGWFIGRPR